MRNAFQLLLFLQLLLTSKTSISQTTSDFFITNSVWSNPSVLGSISPESNYGYSGRMASGNNLGHFITFGTGPKRDCSFYHYHQYRTTFSGGARMFFDEKTRLYNVTFNISDELIDSPFSNWPCCEYIRYGGSIGVKEGIINSKATSAELIYEAGISYAGRGYVTYGISYLSHLITPLISLDELHWVCLHFNQNIIDCGANTLYLSANGYSNFSKIHSTLTMMYCFWDERFNTAISYHSINESLLYSLSFNTYRGILLGMTYSQPLNLEYETQFFNLSINVEMVNSCTPLFSRVFSKNHEERKKERMTRRVRKKTESEYGKSFTAP